MTDYKNKLNVRTTIMCIKSHGDLVKLAFIDKSVYLFTKLGIAHLRSAFVGLLLTTPIQNVAIQ